MDELTFLRYAIILLSAIGIAVWITFYRRRKEPIIITILIWLIDLIAFSIFRLFTGPSSEYYFAVTTWSSVSNLLGVVFLLSAAIIFFPRR